MIRNMQAHAFAQTGSIIFIDDVTYYGSRMNTECNRNILSTNIQKKYY